MPSQLHIKLFGKPQVHLDGERVIKFGTTKTEALFYFLVSTRQPHSRDVLASLLWGEFPDSRARRSLTNALTSLKKTFVGYLTIEPASVAFDEQRSFELDLTYFDYVRSRAEYEVLPEVAEKIAELYRGDFLEGFYVRNAPGFEDWLALEREELRSQTIRVLDTLIQQRLQSGEFSAGIQRARQLLQLDPLRESAHRQLMLLLARSGQRSAALEQYEVCRQLLAAELGVEPMPETEAIYQRLKKAAAPVRHNLVTQALPFVGRLRELSQVIDQLDDPACQLLTILGPGGIGKTRLAAEAARWYVDPERTLSVQSFSDGVFFVPLDSLAISNQDKPGQPTPQQLAGLLAAELAAPIEFHFHGGLDQMEQLCRHLRDKEMLFVLDNFEFLISGAHLLSGLLQSAPNVKLLVTSRERLNLREEWVLTVDGLAYPGDDFSGEERVDRKEWEGAASSRFDAVTLFYQQAAQVNVGREMSAEDEGAVVRITQLVEGSPLGILLAASWLRVLSCAEIREEIEQGIDFLSSSMRDLPARQQSLRAVFDQSWKMLSDREQQVFRRLSVFRGGFTRSAVEAVAGATLGVLTGLLDKSMLFRTINGRYGVHETLRTYGAERLALNPEERQRCRDAHIQYYAQFLHQREKKLFFRQNLEPLLEIRTEMDNIRAYWRRALAEDEDLKYEAINQGLWSLACYYTFGNLFQEAIDALGYAASRLRAERGIQDLLPEEKLVAENVSIALGTYHHWVGDLDLARQRHYESLQELDSMDQTTPGYDTVYGRGLGFLGSTLLLQGEYNQSEQTLRHSLKRMEHSEDEAFFVWTTYLLGMSLFQLGKYVEAEQVLEEALGSLHRSGDYLMHAQCLGFLARTKHELGKSLESVLTQLEALRDQCRKMGAPMLIIQANTHLGITLKLMGEDQVQGARSVLEEGLTVYRQYDLQVPSGLAYLLVALGQVETALEAFEQAEEHLREALGIAISNEMAPIAIDSLLYLAALWTRTRNHPELMESVLWLVSMHPASSHLARKSAEELLGELKGEGAGMVEPGDGGSNTLEALASAILGGTL